MKTFDDFWKLYVFKNTSKVSLSFMVSPRFVKTFHFSINEFEMILETYNDGGYNHMGKCIEHKYAHRPDEYIRFSVDSFHFRLTVGEMFALVQEFYRQLDNEMPWDVK